MKEIKAYIHRSRIADVIAALKASSSWQSAIAGDHNLTLYMVKGSLVPLNQGERRYAVDLGDEVIDEYKLELHCDDSQVQELVKIITVSARTGQSNCGWIYVVDLIDAVPIA